MISHRKVIMSDLERSRILILNAAVAFPVWGYILELLISDTTNWSEPHWIRFLISLIATIGVSLSFLVEKKKKYLDGCVIATGWMVVLHCMWLNSASQFQFPIFFSFLIFLAGFLTIFPTRKSALGLAIAAIAYGIWVAVDDAPSQIAAWKVNLTILFTIIPSLIGNLTRIRNLNFLWETQKELSTVFNNVREGLIILDPHGRITDQNSAAGDILGMSKSEMMGHPFTWSFLKQNGKPLDPKKNPALVAMHEMRTVRDFVMGFVKPDGGTVWLKVTASPYKASPESERYSVLVTLSDITDLKKSEKLLFEQQKRLEEKSKLQALGEMAAGVAHEINNPLAIINGKVTLIQKGLATQKFSEPVEKSLERIKVTVGRIQSIVRGLQIFSKGGDDNEFQKALLHDIVEEALANCSKKIKSSDIKVEVDLESHLTFECRPLQISLCLQNLILNSCDAIEAQPERWIRIWARSAHNSLIIKVTDSGKGIPSEIHEKLMHPFFTTKEVGQGVGLGLSITRGLLEAHLGKIWYDPGSVNTTFVIEVPLEHSSHQSAA